MYLPQERTFQARNSKCKDPEADLAREFEVNQGG